MPYSVCSIPLCDEGQQPNQLSCSGHACGVRSSNIPNIQEFKFQIFKTIKEVDAQYMGLMCNLSSIDEKYITMTYDPQILQRKVDRGVIFDDQYMECRVRYFMHANQKQGNLMLTQSRPLLLHKIQRGFYEDPWEPGAMHKV